MCVTDLVTIKKIQMTFSSSQIVERMIQKIDTENIFIQQEASKSATVEKFARRQFSFDIDIELDFCKLHIYDDIVC